MYNNNAVDMSHFELTKYQSSQLGTTFEEIEGCISTQVRNAIRFRRGNIACESPTKSLHLFHAVIDPIARYNEPINWKKKN